MVRLEGLNYFFKEVLQAMLFRLVVYKPVRMDEVCRSTVDKTGKDIDYLLVSSKPVYI